MFENNQYADGGRNSIAIAIGLLGIAFWGIWSVAGVGGTNEAVHAKSVEMRININTAPAKELMTLPGMGARTSERIIKARQSAHFENISELLRVEGLTNKYLDKIRKFIVF